MRQLTLLTLVTLLSACGGTDPGTGSGTLYVKAALDTDGSTIGTNFVLELRENDHAGTPVTDAVVTLRSQRGEMTTIFPLQAVNDTPVYARAGLEWDTGYVLSVHRGTDRIDAALELPGVTVITDPVQSTTFNRTQGQKLIVRWRDEFGRYAEYPEVRLDQADIRQTLTQDSQEFTVDSMRLVPTNEEHVTVTRTNKVLLQGGLDGSEWTATTHHRIAFKVQ
jgi:hypothetical protein